MPIRTAKRACLFEQHFERAGVLSIIFVISYISMSLPAVIAGWIIAYDGNLVGTAQIFCVFLMALAFTAIFARSVRALRSQPG